MSIVDLADQVRSETLAKVCHACLHLTGEVSDKTGKGFFYSDAGLS